MRLGEAVDGVTGAGGVLKMEVAADVVVLVEGAEEALCFFMAEPKRGNRHSFAVAARDGEIFVHEFAKRGGQRQIQT